LSSARFLAAAAWFERFLLSVVSNADKGRRGTKGNLYDINTKLDIIGSFAYLGLRFFDEESCPGDCAAASTDC
jgi:hypothetical protein